MDLFETFLSVMARAVRSELCKLAVESLINISKRGVMSLSPTKFLEGCQMGSLTRREERPSCSTKRGEICNSRILLCTVIGIYARNVRAFNPSLHVVGLRDL